MKTRMVMSLTLLCLGTACHKRAYNGASTKEVTTYGSDFTTKVPVNKLFIKDVVATSLIKDITFNKSEPLRDGGQVYWLDLSTNSALSCFEQPKAPQGQRKVGCDIYIFSESANTKSMPCDEQCRNENLMYGLSTKDVSPFQKVSLVGFDKEEANVLLASMKTPEKVLGGAPGFYNNLPGKVIVGTTDTSDDAPPAYVFTLMCGTKKAADLPDETRCMLLVTD